MLAISGLVAWRAARRGGGHGDPSAWRDDSLDAWRSERDARSEEDRRRRQSDGGRSPDDE
jgi:hypothetical protein